MSIIAQSLAEHPLVLEYIQALRVLGIVQDQLPDDLLESVSVPVGEPEPVT